MQTTRYVGNKFLRCGYTTGSCAAAAAKAAAELLLTGNVPERSLIRTPKGVLAAMDVMHAEQTEQSACCMVVKDAGDDPDVTDGAEISAMVTRITAGIEIEGGVGVGRVTKPGLDQPVGAAAINSTPRRMIADALREVMQETGYAAGLSVRICVKDGAELAKRTFNPRLGIIGGISILGTSGIVEPMSEQALIDSIRAEISVLAASGVETLLMSPGNYGEIFAKDTLRLDTAQLVQCSNFLGGALSGAAECGIRKILMIGHIGKLVKLGIGLMNTHSSNGDGRMETLCACALAVGAETPLLKEISDCATTDAALKLLYETELLKDTMKELGRRIDFQLCCHVPADTIVGWVCFTNAPPCAGVLMQNDYAEELMKNWRRS
ncbi:MAG: cobalt-precorrin-5B (C(1))-methyltransferase CbiD [Clostridia bacterium]